MGQGCSPFIQNNGGVEGLMAEDREIFNKNKLFHLCNCYLMVFIFLGTVASAYKAHEFFDKHLIAGIFLVIVTAALFFVRTETRAYMALSHFFIFVNLFLVNALLEIPFFADYNSAKITALRSGYKWDTRTKYQVWEDYRKEGHINIFPFVNFSTHAREKAFFAKKFSLDFERKIFPLSGASHAKTILCNESGRWMSYVSDRYGFNNSDRVYENTRDSIIIVGDSFAQGDCVDPGDDVAGNLRRRGYAAITLGAGGNGPLAELATLREYAPYLTPKIILWMYFEGNDFLDLPAEYDYPPLKKYLDSMDYTQNLAQKQDAIDKFYNLIREDFSRQSGWRNFWNREIKGLSWRIILLHNVRKRLGLLHNSICVRAGVGTFNKNEIIFKAVMKAALVEAEKLNSKLYFVYLPAFESFFNDKYPLAQGSQKVRKVISELNIPLIDFFDCLKDTGDPTSHFPFRENGHYNPAGYDLLADIIEKEALHIPD